MCKGVKKKAVAEKVPKLHPVSKNLDNMFHETSAKLKNAAREYNIVLRNVVTIL